MSTVNIPKFVLSVIQNVLFFIKNVISTFAGSMETPEIKELCQRDFFSLCFFFNSIKLGRSYQNTREFFKKCFSSKKDF